MRNTEKEGVAFSFPQDVLQIKPNRITDLGIIHYFPALLHIDENIL